MKKAVWAVSIFSLFLTSHFLILNYYFWIPAPAQADEYDELQKKKEEKLSELEQKRQAETKARQKQSGVSGQIVSVKGQITETAAEIEAKKKLIEKLAQQRDRRQKELTQKIEQRNALISSLYKTSRLSPLDLFLGRLTFGRLAKNLTYYSSLAREGEKRAEELGQTVVALKVNLLTEGEQKGELEKQVAGLSQKKKVLDAELSQLGSYLSSLTSEIANVQGEISHITTRQDQLLREKLSATAQFTSVGDAEEAKQVLPPPPFSPAYAVVSIGYPHRVGLNQYGAYGRSKAGQSAEDIIKAYYHEVEIKKDYAVPGDIEVIGYGRIPFEENYLYGIAEMPTRWADSGGFEALKAQAVAARTYAINVTGGATRPICSSQACQVYYPPKVTAEKAERWRQAVRETRGWVITKNGEPIRAYYSSTFGGYSRLPTDFDVRWNRSFDFLKRIKDADGGGSAYDGPKHGDSPWYYKAWYSPADTHPYLNQEEMLDLLNASLLPESYNGNLSHPDNGGWSRSLVTDELGKLGIRRIEGISSVQPLFSEEGYTLFLRVVQAGGHTDVDGKRFRKVFMLRSRGKLAIWSSLYDLVVK